MWDCAFDIGLKGQLCATVEATFIFHKHVPCDHDSKALHLLLTGEVVMLITPEYFPGFPLVFLYATFL